MYVRNGRPLLTLIESYQVPRPKIWERGKRKAVVKETPRWAQWGPLGPIPPPMWDDIIEMTQLMVPAGPESNQAARGGRGLYLGAPT